MKRVFHFHSILLIICMLLSVSCENRKENNIDSDLELIADKGYFPLQVGNYWQLSYLPERRIDTIEEIESVEYYRLLSGQDTLYYRKSEDGKIFRRTKDTGEIIKFDLSAEEGETWTYSSDYSDHIWYVTLSSKHDTIHLDNYTFYNCYRFFFDIPMMADDEHVIWLAPDIGFVEEAYFGGTFERKKLETVQINGVRIDF